MYSSKYVVLMDKENGVIDRNELLLKAWGELPVSYIQDTEDLGTASYFDVKVNKWEMNKKWSKLQDEEAWIRVEIVRDESLVNFINESTLEISVDKERHCLLVMELDDGWLNIDLVLLSLLARKVSENHQCYVYDGISQYITCSNCFDSLPHKITVKKILEDCGPNSQENYSGSDHN